MNLPQSELERGREHREVHRELVRIRILAGECLIALVCIAALLITLMLHLGGAF